MAWADESSGVGVGWAGNSVGVRRMCREGRPCCASSCPTASAPFSSLVPHQGHEIELLDQLTGGRVVPTAAGEEEAQAQASQATWADAPGAGGGGEGEVFRPSTFSFLRSVTLRGPEEDERRGSEGADGAAEAQDPAAAEATRRAFEGAVLAQWQRLRAMRAT